MFFAFILIAAIVKFPLTMYDRNFKHVAMAEQKKM